MAVSTPANPNPKSPLTSIEMAPPLDDGVAGGVVPVPFEEGGAP